jgi:predicted outer membrane repeat protein
VCSQSSVCAVHSTLFDGNTVVTTGGAFFSELRGLVTVWDSVFQNHRANQGGGTLYGSTYAAFTLHNCSVVSSSTYGKGGAVQMQAFASIVTYNTTFRANSASIGGAVHAEFNSQISFFDTIFENNLARYLGVSPQHSAVLYSWSDVFVKGAVSALDTVIVHADRVVMFDNSALYGGAIYLLIECIMDIKHFHAYNNSADVQGGMLMASGLVSAVLEFGLIEGHSASYGAVFDISAQNVTVDIRHSVILRNNAYRDAGVARVLDEATLSMTNCTVFGNSAEFGGANMISSAFASFRMCTFHQNFASDSGGAFRAAYSTISMVDCNLEGNGAVEAGGAMLMESGSTLTVMHCAVHNNSALEFGGAFSMSDDTNAVFTLTNFTSNIVGGYGGAVYVNKRGVYEFHRCRFQYNIGSGGSVLYADTDSDVHFTSSVMKFNRATSVTDGGCLHLKKISSLNLENCVFENCTGGLGAAVFMDRLGSSSQSRRRLGVMDEVTAFTDGYQAHRSSTARSMMATTSVYRVSITKSTFLSNAFDSVHAKDMTSCDNSDENGGAIMLLDVTSDTLVDGCVFKKNYACYGAGLYSSSSVVDVKNSVFDLNKAVIAGGGMFWKVIQAQSTLELITTENIINTNSNTAKYGPLMATDRSRLIVQPHGIEASGVKFQSPLVLSVQVCMPTTAACASDFYSSLTLCIY